MFIVKKYIHFSGKSHIHGLKYTTEKKRPFIIRICWLLILIVSSWGMYQVLIGTLRSSNNGSLNYTPDTLYLHWTTTFPAVSVCEKYNYHAVVKKLTSIYPDFMSGLDFTRKKNFAEMMFATGTCGFCNTVCSNDDNVNCSVDWRAMADSVRKPCQDLIYNCSWMSKPLDCCSWFLPVDSELGTCYTFNTLQSKITGSVPIVTTNRSTGPGHLTFFYNTTNEVFIHGVEDVPRGQMVEDLHFETSDRIDFIFSIVEMENDPRLKHTTKEFRGCRYLHEVDHAPMDYFRTYGYTTCVTACETRRRYEECGCIHYLRDQDYKDLYCNYSGLGCLANFLDKMQTEIEVSDPCEECLPSCTEMEITKVYMKDYGLSYENGDEREIAAEDLIPRVDVRLSSLPTLRYSRNLLRNQLDLVVSVGGLAGLFFGASLLSILEAIYLMCLR